MVCTFIHSFWVGISPLRCSIKAQVAIWGKMRRRKPRPKYVQECHGDVRQKRWRAEERNHATSKGEFAGRYPAALDNKYRGWSRHRLQRALSETTLCRILLRKSLNYGGIHRGWLLLSKTCQHILLKIELDLMDQLSSFMKIHRPKLWYCRYACYVL